MKKLGLIALLSVLTIGAFVGCGNPSSSEAVSSEEQSSESNVVTLPAPWAEGATYQNKECSVSLVPGSIDGQAADVKPVSDYLGVEGIRFIDLRDASEGYSEGHVEGFESISYFNVIVGKGDAANTTLFKSVDGSYVANYDESEFYLNKMFPKDQTLFLMCAVGGRVTPFIQLLKQYGYDMSKVYNVGGWNQVLAAEDYAGYSVSLGLPASSITYDFSALTPVTAAKAAKRSNTLPAPWAEGATYQNKECSVSLVPGSIDGQAADVKPVSDFLNEKIRFIDLRDPSEGYSEGHVGKFESISYFNLIVGKGDAANTTLFKLVDGSYVANYDESEFYLNKMFPKDETLFLMCAVGGRVTPFIQLLKQYGYDMSKVYNVGGWNQVLAAEDYAGYSVSLGLAASSITYDFSALTPVAA